MTKATRFKRSCGGMLEIHQFENPQALGYERLLRDLPQNYAYARICARLHAHTHACSCTRVLAQICVHTYDPSISSSVVRSASRSNQRFNPHLCLSRTPFMSSVPSYGCGRNARVSCPKQMYTTPLYTLGGGWWETPIAIILSALGPLG